MSSAFARLKRSFHKGETSSQDQSSGSSKQQDDYSGCSSGSSQDIALEEIGQASFSYITASGDVQGFDLETSCSTHGDIHSPERTGSLASSTMTDSDSACSFASVDTISDAEAIGTANLDGEKNWRMRKLLKYSRWKSKFSSAAGSDPSTNKKLMALDRKTAKQESKLNRLELRREQARGE